MVNLLKISTLVDFILEEHFSPLIHNFFPKRMTQICPKKVTSYFGNNGLVPALSPAFSEWPPPMGIDFTNCEARAECYYEFKHMNF